MSDFGLTSTNLNFQKDKDPTLRSAPLPDSRSRVRVTQDLHEFKKQNSESVPSASIMTLEYFNLKVLVSGFYHAC